jgi:hypothetical protein
MMREKYNLYFASVLIGIGLPKFVFGVEPLFASFPNFEKTSIILGLFFILRFMLFTIALYYKKPKM